MENMADQDELVGSYPPMTNFPASGIGMQPGIPFKFQEFRKSSSGVHTHNDVEDMTNEEMLAGGPGESYIAIWSVVTVPTAAAQEARGNQRVDELPERLVKEYPCLFSGVANKNPPDRGQFGTAGIKLKPNPKVYGHREYQLQSEWRDATKTLFKDVFERRWMQGLDSEWASPAFIMPKKAKGEWRILVNC